MLAAETAYVKRFASFVYCEGTCGIFFFHPALLGPALSGSDGVSDPRNFRCEIDNTRPANCTVMSEWCYHDESQNRTHLLKWMFITYSTKLHETLHLTTTASYFPLPQRTDGNDADQLTDSFTENFANTDRTFIFRRSEEKDWDNSKHQI